MSCADSNNGKKRHLPPWMLRSEPEVKAKVDDSEAVENAACKPKSTAHAKEKRAAKTKRRSCENESEKAESSLPKRSETQRSRRELDRKHKVRLVSDAGTVGSDREKETYAPPKKKRKPKALKGTSSDNAVEDSARSEEELTVEDLVSIAKEHINNATMDVKLSSEIVGRSKGPSSSTNISKDEQIHIQCDDGSSVRNCSKSTSSSDLLENQPNDSKSITGSPSKKTRDPTQDILELLLGPLYKSI